MGFMIEAFKKEPTNRMRALENCLNTNKKG
jgi:hypothetical protein